MPVGVGGQGGVEVAEVIEVEDYQFNADGTGYYERYCLDDELLVAVKAVRDDDTFHYTIDGYTITITGDILIWYRWQMARNFFSCFFALIICSFEKKCLPL